MTVYPGPASLAIPGFARTCWGCGGSGYVEFIAPAGRIGYCRNSCFTCRGSRVAPVIHLTPELQADLDSLARDLETRR